MPVVDGIRRAPHPCPLLPDNGSPAKQSGHSPTSYYECGRPLKAEVRECGGHFPGSSEVGNTNTGPTLRWVAWLSFVVQWCWWLWLTELWAAVHLRHGLPEICKTSYTTGDLQRTPTRRQWGTKEPIVRPLLEEIPIVTQRIILREKQECVGAECQECGNGEQNDEKD
ncbi:uncharacterized protein LOC123502084 isoform X2 [Portunus trituberculatus]|uniref:uncharacterized protein LOC123502084 isoform X2 n=1 Tax=Portunus trituberculatus TaxID=210409 RepID=UPI001E1CBC66|nr:uncharacterized protein LOC123502084 isoform X2 [Portunus trituberculatus]